MNKLVAILVGGVVVVGAGTAIIISRGSDDDSVKVTNSATRKSQEVKTGNAALVDVDACDVLTDAAAKAVIGDGATKGDTSAGNASSDDVSVSNCAYNYKSVTTGPALDQLKSNDSVGLLVRAAKTKTGADSNKAVFGSQKPANVQDVSGYGDKAFFNPAYGQLNILKGGNWYILSHYKGVSGTSGTLEQAKQLADAIKSNLK